MLNEDKSINYEQLEKQSTAITNGIAHIDRRSLREEEGRLEGGKRNVEASILLGVNEATSPEAARDRQEKELIEFAKKNKLSIDPSKFNEDNFVQSGDEPKVYQSPKNGHLLKVVDYRRHSKLPSDYLEYRISIHNSIFNVPYRLVGFTIGQQPAYSCRHCHHRIDILHTRYFRQ